MAGIVSFGEWIQTRRNQLRYTRKGFAELVGYAPITIKKIEKDERKPSIEMAELLATHLQIPESEQEDFIRRARGEFVPHLGSPAEMSLAEAQAPAIDEEARKHNLPLQTTTFFGRAQELADIDSQLNDPHCRLLTILATGGMGKTRLSIEAATAQLDNFTDGVTYVELAPISAEDSDTGINPLATVLAAVLQFSFHGADTPERQLFAYLRRREMLIVFDNFEHLLDTAELVGDFLQNAPDIKFLITSRERLDLQEEWLFALQGLSFQEATHSEAVQLFAQRAKQVQSSFDLEAELEEVTRVCQLVEGMPLALELAAAWTLQLSCAEIAEEIEAEIDFLATRARNVPERHRSMRAVFDTSWDKLSSKEKEVLQKASVFRGGFDRRAAREVVGVSLITLSDLVSKSFLSVTENGSFGKLRTPRYTIHELLRQFAAERLGQSAELEKETQRKHCHYFMGVINDQNLIKRGAEGVTALFENSDNVRIAIRWANSYETALFTKEIAGSLGIFYELKGLSLERADTFQKIFERLKETCKPSSEIISHENTRSCLRAAYYQLELGWAYLRLHRLDKIEESAKLTLHYISSQDGKEAQTVRAYSYWLFGMARFGKGEYAQALTLLQQTSELMSTVDNGPTWGFSLFMSNVICPYLGEFELGEQYLESGMKILTESHDQVHFRNYWHEKAKYAIFRGI